MNFILKKTSFVLLTVTLVLTLSFCSTNSTGGDAQSSSKFPTTSSLDYFDEEKHLLDLLDLAINAQGKLEYYSKAEAPELYCLAENIYHEARSDNFVGQIAVADVVLNRVVSSQYPNSICEVVKEGPVTESWKTKKLKELNDKERIYYPIRNRCQFSWYCDGAADIIRFGDAWFKAQRIAYALVHHKKWRGITEGATHYHATYVTPKWSSTLQLIGRIGLHVFYRKS